ncbi:hypothetical protein SAMN05444352_13050 [Pseudomonas japonica]|uniref:Uncharacterized protein n=1 Tax=Pseudomonas japonica TaxID=256466 RepID=A0A239L116_9PSED|nr:hypothetical protein SAMN05444352_13050 [Pseudomonas japonica]
MFDIELWKLDSPYGYVNEGQPFSERPAFE